MEAVLDSDLSYDTLSWSDQLEQRMVAELRTTVKAWDKQAAQFPLWEHRHLATNPSPEKLKEHEKGVRNMIRLGKLLLLSAGAPEFPEKDLAKTIRSTISALEVSHRMWHTPPMLKAESDAILASVFGEA